MSNKKLEIYNYWKGKAITNNFQVKDYVNCEEKDEALPIIEFSDSICCWACGLPSLILDEYNADINDDLKKDWNNDKTLQKSHILAKSLGGGGKADNMFLLCPNCHADSPDTGNVDNFFAWIYYKRKNDNYVNMLSKELEHTCKMKNVNFQKILDYLPQFDYEKIMEIRKQGIEACTMHGSFISMSSKMMVLIDEVIKDIQ